MRVGRHLGDCLSAFVDGELSLERTAAARVHLAACRRCADRVAEERQVRGVLTAAAVPELPPWFGVALRGLPTSDAPGMPGPQANASRLGGRRGFRPGGWHGSWPRHAEGQRRVAATTRADLPTVAPLPTAAQGPGGNSLRSRRVQARLGTVLAGVAVAAVVSAGALATGAVMGRTATSPPVPVARFSAEQELVTRLVITTATARAMSTPSTDIPGMLSARPAATVTQPGDDGSGR